MNEALAGTLSMEYHRNREHVGKTNNKGNSILRMEQPLNKSR